MNPSRFENRIRKAKLVENWTAFFKKSVFSNELEKEKRSQRYRYKVNFRYVVLNAGKIDEQNLEPFVKSGDLKEINSFLKKNSVDWEKTGEFTLFSAFGIPIVQNKNFHEGFDQSSALKRVLFPSLSDRRIKFMLFMSFPLQKGK